MPAQCQQPSEDDEYYEERVQREYEIGKQSVDHAGQRTLVGENLRGSDLATDLLAARQQPGVGPSLQ